MHMAVETHNLTVFLKENPVLVDINVALEKEQIVGLIGPVGAGKATFFDVLLGLVKPSFGSVRINGVDIRHGNDEVSYMPTRESVRFNFPATLMEFVLLGRCRKTPWFFSLTRRDKDLTMDALEMVGLADLAGKQIGQLSYGQQQRLLLARAIAQEGDLLLLDEPFINVGLETELLVLEVLRELCALGKTIIIAYHDLAVGNDFFDNVLFLQTTLCSYSEDELQANKLEEMALDALLLDRGKAGEGKDDF